VSAWNKKFVGAGIHVPKGAGGEGVKGGHKGENRVETPKGDLSTDRFLVEHKRTIRKSMSVQREWLEKVSAGARRVAKDPMVVITFSESRVDGDWALVPLSVLERLIREQDDS
jgi:hypothetical protein